MNMQFGQAVLQRGSAQTERDVAAPGSKEVLRFRLYVLLLLADAGSLAAGFAVGNLLRFGDMFQQDGLKIAGIMMPVFLLSAFYSRAYSPEVLADWRRGAKAVLRMLVASAVALLFFGFFLRSSQDISRVMLGTSVVAAAVFLVAARAGLHRVGQRILGGAPLGRVLILDGTQFTCPPGYDVIDAARAGLSLDMGDPMMLDRLGRFLRKADGVVVACPATRRAAWAMALKGANIRGEILMPEVADVGGIGTARCGGETTMIVSAGSLGTRDRALKRGLDVGIALIALIALAPLLAAVALAIRLDDGGPTLFAQDRLGRGNRLFRMHKFRSMRTSMCDNAGNQSTRRDDDRITRVGRFIRATSIDELPQLFNILRGDMSFVGPRPHALGSLAGDKLFWEIDQRYWHRHACKPGLTGLAQVRGFRGATHVQADLVNRLHADLEYLNGWTLWRDISILLATVRVLVHKNAY